MNKRFTLTHFFVALAFLFCTKGIGQNLPTDISQKGKPATLKILLIKLSPKVLLDVQGRYLIYDAASQFLIESGQTENRNILSCSTHGIKWGDEVFPGTYSIRIVPKDAKTSISVNGILYKGVIEVHSIGATLNVVNEIDVENYLKSMLSQIDFLDPYADEVLDAVAIVSRTNLYYLASKHPEVSWHIEAEKVGYVGSTNQKKSLERAVERTRALILTHQNEPFPTILSIDCAGKTASYRSIYRKNVSTPPGVSSLPSSFQREKKVWSFKLNMEQLNQILECNKIHKIDLFKDSASGKIYAVRFYHGSETKDLDFFALQNILGQDKLLSNDFMINIEDAIVTFTGYGYGSGVGLCLSSAEILAKRKENVKKILSIIFPETELMRRQGIDTFSFKFDSQSSHLWR